MLVREEILKSRYYNVGQGGNFKKLIYKCWSGRKPFLFSPAGLFPSFDWLISLLRQLFPLTPLLSKFDLVSQFVKF